MQLTVNDYNIVIDGEWSGKYYPATRETPEEREEFEIHAVCLEDSEINILGIISQDFLADIYNEIYR
jgi:hypothetical protein